MNFNLDLMLPYEQEVRDAVQRVITEKQFILGKNVRAFEAAWAAFTGQRYAVGVGNGTDAIRLALLALGIKPGDEVISPAFNVAYTALAVTSIGAVNKFVDCGDDMLMDPHALEAEVTDRTRAIIPVHLFGTVCNMDQISVYARNAMIVEDCAQAHGAVDQMGNNPGWFSQAAAYSFYPTKNLGALGEAGGVTTNIEVVAERLRLLRDGGRTDRYLHVLPGINSCLDEMQAAVLSVKLQYLEQRNQQRRQHARRYLDQLTNVGDLVLPAKNDVYHLFVVRTKERERLLAHLTAAGIPALVHYPVPVPYQPCFMESRMGGPWPKAEAAAREVLSLPMHADLTKQDQDRVVASIREFYGE